MQNNTAREGISRSARKRPNVQERQKNGRVESVEVQGRDPKDPQSRQKNGGVERVEADIQLGQKKRGVVLKQGISAFELGNEH